MEEEPEGIILVGSRPPLKWPTPNLLALIVGMDGDGLSDSSGFALRKPDGECAQATSVNKVTLPTP